MDGSNATPRGDGVGRTTDVPFETPSADMVAAHESGEGVQRTVSQYRMPRSKTRRRSRQRIKDSVPVAGLSSALAAAAVLGFVLVSLVAVRSILCLGPTVKKESHRGTSSGTRARSLSDGDVLWLVPSPDKPDWLSVEACIENPLYGSGVGDDAYALPFSVSSLDSESTSAQQPTELIQMSPESVSRRRTLPWWWRGALFYGLLAGTIVSASVCLALFLYRNDVIASTAGIALVAAAVLAVSGPVFSYVQLRRRLEHERPAAVRTAV